MHRFFVSPESIKGNTVVITGGLAHQLCHVLRLGGGERIVVLDNSGWEYQVELGGTGRERVEGKVLTRSIVSNEPHTRIILCQALLKANKFEFVLQKGTELGVTGFVPLLCERCVANRVDTKLARWRRIIVEAAEQAGRGKLPLLSGPMPFEEACRKASGFSLLPWEGESKSSLRFALESQRLGEGGKSSLSVNLFIGPEGGFSGAEVEFARSCGIIPVTLGPRLLRAETAGLVAASAILYHCGDLERL